MSIFQTVRPLKQALCAGLAAFLALPGSAVAQQQTQEGAVKFLNLYASQHQLPVGSSPHFDKIDALTRLKKPVPSEKWIGTSEFDKQHPCRVDLRLSGQSTELVDWDKVDVFMHTWSDVMKASDYGALAKPTIEIRQTQYSSSIVIWPADEQQGARLMKAFQFLKDSCDPMKETGF